jgi:hypothetical protein
MQERSIELIELIEANPFTPIESIIEDFFGADLVLALKSDKSLNRDEIIRILNEAGIEDVL